MIKVYIIESERGWGQKIDETKEFETLDEAQAFIKKYNAVNNEERVPDLYWKAVLADKDL